MPQSLSYILIHIVFSTKDRAPVLETKIRPELYSYLATVIRNNGCECYRIGGVSDHIHLALNISRTTSIAKIVELIKTASSKWLKTKLEGVRFSWQRGYGAFSVSPGNLEKLIQYIDNQEKHHNSRDFKDEFRAFLKKYKIQFDEKYVWD